MTFTFQLLPMIQSLDLVNADKIREQVRVLPQIGFCFCKIMQHLPYLYQSAS